MKISLTLIVFPDVLCVSVVKGEDTWRVTHSSAQICAVKGSTVEIPCTCTYTYPSTIRQQTTVVQSRFWFTKDRYEPVDVRTDPDYSGRVEYLFHENVCTLRIKNLTERDSAVYKFMFTTNQPGGSLTGDEGVTLSITGNILILSIFFIFRVNTTAELKCYSSCNVADNPSYVWYRNGKNMTAETSSIRCLTFYNLLTLPHFNIQKMFSPPDAPKLPSVSVSPSAEIVEGSSVTLTCSSDANPAANYTWFKENNNQPLSREAQLVFSSIKSSDSGEFSCKTFLTDLISLFSKWGSSVTLTCSSDANPAANYTWFKEDEDSPTASGQIFTISNFSADHSGRYYCEAQNTRGRHNSTLHLLVVAGKLFKFTCTQTCLLHQTRFTFKEPPSCQSLTNDEQRVSQSRNEMFQSNPTSKESHISIFNSQGTQHS
uniref:Ig-like domain-containing protein n=1 Tax=Labrus bergylta TaxID=56723 RepID=A0A3Q3GPX6_9LABR